MPLKNYTTQVPVERTVAEIEKILAKYGATDIWKHYDGIGNVTGINFIVPTDIGKIPFKIPAKPEAVRAILVEKRKRGYKAISAAKATDMGHARRVCWRIIKDWIHAQISLIELDQVKIEEVFLPYALNTRTNETVFKTFEKKGFAKLIEEHKEEKSDNKEVEAVILE